ncbi:hypothetical protein TIFTF001_030977 [Ficus carica]|uniref:Protein kinase domain-containing protein n=1 Tax=Ficus carica TaxID=3494 RepID=A0AA88DU16_FICCA|nr:hypothetical protein TIFTF001_030977 [Ficus carica]
MDKYERLEDLGWKEYRIHYKYRHKESNKVAALKTLRLQSTDDFGIPRMTLRKISLLKEIDHDNVARLLDVIYDERLGRVHLMLEYVDVHLKSLILTNPVRATDRRFIRNTLEQILRGLYCYHSMNIAHGNINPLNVLLDCTNLTVKLTDLDREFRGIHRLKTGGFGSVSNRTCWFPKPEADDPAKHGELHSVFRPPTGCDRFCVDSVWLGFLKGDLVVYKLLITPSYKAPELLYDPSAEITPTSDVFSVGCIFAEMLTRRPLFDGATKYHEILSIFRLVGNFESYSTTNSPEGNRPAASEDPGTKSNILSPPSNQAEWTQITRKLEKIIPDFKPAGIDLLSRMLCPNPSRRITVEEALKHPYFKLGSN